MVSRPNIIFIMGTNSFLVDREKQWLIRAFREKYGAENIASCPIDDASAYPEYEGQLQSMGLFASKRLFLYSGGRKKGSKTPGFEESLDRMLPLISEDDFLIFSHISPYEWGLIKWLEQYATIRKRDLSWKAKDWEPYTSLSTWAISNTLKYYQNRESLREKGDVNPFLGHAILNTLTALSILETSGIAITNTYIQDFSHTYEWGRIFDLVDCIMSRRIGDALKLLKQITHGMNANESRTFVSSLIGILRQSLYIISLRDQGHTAERITDLLGRIHPYVVKKNISSPLSWREIGELYKKLILSNIAYKSGKWMQKSELWRILDIEIALLELKK